MPARSRSRSVAFGALAALAGLTAAGCGHGTTAAPSSNAPPTATASPTSTPRTTPSAAPTSSAVPTTASASPPTVAPTGPCTTAQLAVSLGPGAIAGGRTTVALTFRNTAVAACTLRGTPAVDVLDSFGMQAGPAAGALPGTAPTAIVILAQGDRASAGFSYVAATGDGGAACSPDTAVTLLVFAPGSTTSAKVPFAVSICTTAADRPGITPVSATG